MLTETANKFRHSHAIEYLEYMNKHVWWYNVYA